MKRLLVLSILVLLCSLISLTRFVSASSDTLLIDKQTFNVSVNNETRVGQANIPFNITLTQYNGTFAFQYVNLLNGVRTDNCYITQFNIVLDGRMVVTETFAESNAQGVDLHDLNFTSAPGSYNGTLTLFGTSEGLKFYGTTSLMLTENDPSNGGVHWTGSIFDWGVLSIVVVPSSVAVILFIRRRRHRND